MSSTSTFRPRKRINDPLHGAVFLSPLEYKLATCPTFLRLANVKQLGLGAFVYPGATYSRQEHSIGACHVVGQMLDAVEANGATLTERERRITRVAALLHDLGHYPFSHATEEAVHQVDGASVVSGQTSSVEYFADHEDLGRFLIQNDPAITAILSDGGIDPSEIVARLEGGDETSLNLLVSSDLDCDRLDYLRRTALHAGLPYGGVDAEYLVDNLTLDVDGLPCLHSKAVGAADHFLISRLYDFEQVPFHKAVVGYEEALKKTIAAMMAAGAVDLSKAAIEQMILSDTWRRLDDQMVIGKIRTFRDEISSAQHFSPVQAYIDCILNRRAPKLVLDAQYMETLTPTSEDRFTKFVEICTETAVRVYDEFGIDRELTFGWARTFRILKGKESGQRIRILSNGDRSQRSWSIDEAVRTLCSQLDEFGRRHFRLYACLNSHTNPKELRDKLKARIQELIGDDDLPAALDPPRAGAD